MKFVWPATFLGCRSRDTFRRHGALDWLAGIPNDRGGASIDKGNSTGCQVAIPLDGMDQFGSRGGIGRDLASARDRVDERATSR